MIKKDIVFVGTLTPVIFLNAFFLAVITLVLLSLNNILFYLSIVTSAFLGFELMKQLIRYISFKVYITNTSLIISSGIIKKNLLEISLSHIDGVSYHQGYLGRLMRFGNISIIVSGIEQKSIESIRFPKTFSSKLMSMLNIEYHLDNQHDDYKFKEQIS
ncbi:MAG: PH domain-containing protein [Legionellales bacterium]|nr:PH domain-containing protein [Legionellales bacterium]